MQLGVSSPYSASCSSHLSGAKIYTSKISGADTGVILGVILGILCNIGCISVILGV